MGSKMAGVIRRYESVLEELQKERQLRQDLEKSVQFLSSKCKRLEFKVILSSTRLNEIRNEIKAYSVMELIKK